MNLLRNVLGKWSIGSGLLDKCLCSRLNSYLSSKCQVSSLASGGLFQHHIQMIDGNGPVYSQIREYKAKVRLRKRCRQCKFLWRNGRLYVECEAEPRHKQFHKKSFLKGFDSIPYGYDVKAEKKLAK